MARNKLPHAESEGVLTEIVHQRRSNHMAIIRKIALLSFAALLAAGIAGCDRDTDAEEVGERLDEQLNDAGNAVEDACEEVKEEANAEDTDC